MARVKTQRARQMAITFDGCEVRELLFLGNLDSKGSSYFLTLRTLIDFVQNLLGNCQVSICLISQKI